MRQFILLLAFLLYQPCTSQGFNTIEFNESKNQISRNGMWVLGSWGAANVIGSGIGAISTDGEAQAFHQMNVAWGAINTGIAAVSLITSRNTATDLSQVETIKQLESTKRIYLFNTALDVAYMATGAYMIEKSKTIDEVKRSDQLKGFGKSFIFQGAGLMIFDAVMYIAHTRNGNNLLYNRISSLYLGPNGFIVSVDF